MDPTILYASPERIREEVKAVLDSYGNGEGHIFNLGHGIHPGIDPENVSALLNMATMVNSGLATDDDGSIDNAMQQFKEDEDQKYHIWSLYIATVQY